jgi:hypothetical protein
MIRRGFWLTAGAVSGIYGYRRVSAIGRRLSASLTPGARLAPASNPRTSLALSARRSAVALAVQTYRFTRDVREGMELYRLAHSVPAGSTLPADLSTDRDEHPEDGH